MCADFHNLLYDLLRRCVCGELGADEAAAFLKDIAAKLVRNSFIVASPFPHYLTLFSLSRATMRVFTLSWQTS